MNEGSNAGSGEQLQTPRKVLVVDDDPTQLKLTRIRLSGAGFDVDTAGDAVEALERVAEQRPDAILSDVVMGEVDGFGLCRRVRQDKRFDSIPIILMSAHYREEPEQQLAQQVGAFALVSRTPDFDLELETLKHSLADKDRFHRSRPDAASYEAHLKTVSTQLRKALVSARASENRYRALFDHANDTIAIVDGHGVILEANRRWRDVLGYGPEDLVGKHIAELAVPGFERSNIEELTALFERGGGHTRGVPLLRADGATIFMEFSTTVVDVDGTPLVFTIGRDVTESVRTAHVLAAAEDRYRTLIERIPDVIWTATEDATLTFVTPNVEALFGYTADELMNESVSERMERVHIDDRERVKAGLIGFAGEGVLFDLEYRRQHKDGRYIWVRNRAIGRYERGGKRYIEGMISDVSERKLLEESLRQAQKMEAVGQLSGGIAHDFNNILAVILANAHFLMDELSVADTRREAAEELKQAAERGATLTRQLLAFSRRQIMQPAVVDLNEALTGVAKLLRRLIGEDVQLTIVQSPQLCPARVDLGQFEQVVMNLVVNARDAMPAGGKVTLETGFVEVGEGRNAHPLLPRGSYVTLTVSDTGCGMDEETQRHVFEPFFTTKEIGRGTGLGLSTCYGIVKASGGQIAVRSELGVGSVFTVYLPCAEAKPENATAAVRQLPTGGTETVLLIEDDPCVQRVLGRMLRTRGFQPLIAKTPADALVLAREFPAPIHAILSDVVMPGTSGPAIVAEVQKARPHARVLFMSGYTDHEMLRARVLEGGVSFIQKPFTPEMLAKGLRTVLDQTAVSQSDDAAPR